MGHQKENYPEHSSQIYNRIAEKRKNQGVAMAQFRLKTYFNTVVGSERNCTIANEFKVEKSYRIVGSSLSMKHTYEVSRKYCYLNINSDCQIKYKL